MATRITRTNIHNTQSWCERLASADVGRCTAMKSERTIIHLSAGNNLSCSRFTQWRSQGLAHPEGQNEEQNEEIYRNYRKWGKMRKCSYLAQPGVRDWLRPCSSSMFINSSSNLVSGSHIAHNVIFRAYYHDYKKQVLAFESIKFFQTLHQRERNKLKKGTLDTLARPSVLKRADPGGYSDLVWTGVCAARASKPLPIFKGHFEQKRE